jgi:hypothetical protein
MLDFKDQHHSSENLEARINKIEHDLDTIRVEPARTLEFLHVAPEKPRLGQIVGADGTDWDPGSGQGIYCYYNSTWNHLLDGVAASLLGLDNEWTGDNEFSGVTEFLGAAPVIFQGATDHATNKITVNVTDPTGARQILIPDATVDLVKLRAATTSLDGVSEHATGAEVEADTPSSSLVITPDSLRAGFTIVRPNQSAVSGSPTEIDFTGIPSWVRKVTVLLNGVSSSGSSNIISQLGDSGGFHVTNYLGGESSITITSANGANQTVGLGMGSGNAGNIISGICTWYLMDPATFLWVGFSMNGRSNSSTRGGGWGSCRIPLDSALTQVRITTVGGSNTFDGTGSSIGLQYE